MPSKPDDLYGTFGSVPSTASEGGGPVPFSVRATPNDMGAQVGEAVSKAGDVGNEIAVKYQGMVNETLATNAETEYMKQLGALTGDFKSKEGLEAVSALPDYIKNVSGLRQTLRGGLPIGASHAFDMLALRHEGFAIGDANTYSAAQVRQADYNSAAVSIASSIDGASQPGIADNDQRFNDHTDNIAFQTTRQFTDTAGFRGQDASGKAVFDDSPEGQASKADYDQRVSHAISQAYVNRYNGLMEGNVLGAFEKYKQDRDSMPAAAKVNLDATFAPRVATAQAKQTVEAGLGAANQIYAKSVATPEDVVKNYGASPVPVANNLGNVKTPAAASAGVAGFVKYATPVDGVIGTANTLRNNYQGLTLTQIGAKWTGESPEKASAWVANVSRAGGLDPNTVPNLNDPATLTKMMNGIAAAEKSADDRAQFTPDVIGQGVQASLNGQHANTSSGVPAEASAIKPPNLADHYRMNYASIIQDNLARAEQMHPGDVHFAEMVRTKTEQRLNDVIRQQEMAYKVDSDMVMTAANGSMTNGKRPTSIEEIQQINPEVSAAVDRMMTNSPQAYSLLENRLLAANSKGQNKAINEYGTPILRIQNDILHGKITNMTQLLQYLPPDENAKGDFLTVAGVEKASSMLKMMETNGDELKIQAAAFDGVKNKFMGTNMDFEDPKGKAAYDASVPLMYKAWEEGRAQKISPYELANPESSHWVGLATKATWLTPQQQYINLMNASLKPGQYGPIQTPLPPIDASKPVPGVTDESAESMKQAYVAEKDPQKKRMLKARMIKLFNLVDDEQAALAPISR